MKDSYCIAEKSSMEKFKDLIEKYAEEREYDGETFLWDEG